VRACLWGLMERNADGSARTFVLPFVEDTSGEAWDSVLGALGLMGRGAGAPTLSSLSHSTRSALSVGLEAGLDRLPRGVYLGAVRARIGGNMVIVLGSNSPLVRESKWLTARLPFPPAPNGRSALVEGACAPTDAQRLAAMRGTEWRVFVAQGAGGARHCASLCGVDGGRQCVSADMWAAAADAGGQGRCVWLDAMLRRLSRGTGTDARAAEGGCDRGCDLDAEGVHAPGLEVELLPDGGVGLGIAGGEEGRRMCRVPAPVAMSCWREDSLPGVGGLKLCPCRAG
jgi:hypothetical protein